MHTQKLLTEKLKSYKVDFIHFVDISLLAKGQNKGFPNAILFGMVLSPKYLKKVSNTPDYVQEMKRNHKIQFDEFHLTEQKTDKIADELANFLKENGFEAYSQSEANIEATGFYDKRNHRTPLPHKTIALMADMGWIGKHNLLVTTEFGSGISMCSVLTNAPLETVSCIPQKSQCGKCTVCVDICLANALTGNNWDIENSRYNLLNIRKCTTCLQCMVNCPWTQKYFQ